MPVPTQTLWNIRRLNVWFAVSSILSVATLAWMLKEDFEHPWRDYQIQSFNNQAAAAHFELLALTSDEANARREPLVREVEAYEQRLKSNPTLIQCRRQLDEVTGRLADAALKYGNSNAEYQVELFELEELKALHGQSDPRTLAMARKVEERRKALDEYKAAKDRLEDAQASLKQQIKDIEAPLTRARKALSDIDKKIATAQRNEEFLGPGIKRSFFNFPGLDFLAPKGTPGREEIKQVVLENVQQDYNFLKSYSVDRCMTCHVAIDQPSASLEQYVSTCESALRAVNERRVKTGQAPLVVPPPGTPRKNRAPAAGHAGEALAAPPGPTAGSPPAQWPATADMTAAQKKEYLGLLVDTLNEYLAAEGRPTIEFDHPLLAHPRLDLFVSPDSPHPMSKMGCTVCHEGNGQETDFMFAAHTPSTHEQEHEWEHKYVQRTWGIPQMTFHLLEEYWDRPMMAARYTSATCAKCHTEIADLATAKKDGMAEKLVQGRQLFTQLGCINCHNVQGLSESRKVAPDLTHVNEKLETGFLHRWIDYPSEFRPATLMPHFFRQENNLPSSANEFDPNPVLRTEVEIQAITRYLQTFSRGYDAHPLPEGVKGDAARGAELFTSVGCLACHANLAAPDPTDDSETKRSIGERWIVRDLIQSGRKPEEAAAEFKRMDLNAQIRYAMQHFTSDRHAAATRKLDEMRNAGEDTSSLYVPPEYTRFAPDLSGLATKLLPNPDDAAVALRARTWLYNWLLEPQHYHPGAKMPRLFTPNYYWREGDVTKRPALADADIMDVVEYLLTLRHDTFKPAPIEVTQRHRELTPTLIKTLLGGQYTEQAAADMAVDKAAPGEPYGPLTAAIVKQVEKSLGRDEALKRIPPGLFERQQLFLGIKMVQHYGCYACHLVTGFENASRPGTDLTEWGSPSKRLSQLDFAFFSPGYEKLWEEKKDIFGWLYPKATKDSPSTSEFDHLALGNGNEPQQITHSRAAFAYHKVRNPRIWDREKIKKPYDKLKMPNFFLTPDQAQALTTFLLSRISPPLVQPAVQVDYANTTAGGVAQGRHLTAELNCVACHKIEDNQPIVHQYGLVSDPSGGVMIDELNLPPWLHGEGAKVNYNWLHRFLRQVVMLRPWLKIRMPMFHLDDQQATTLVKYFAQATQKESSDVMKRLKEIHEFQDKAARAAPAATQPASQPSDRRPGDTWFADAVFAPIKQFLADYALRYRLAKPSDLDEKANKTEDLVAPWSETVGRVEFLTDLYQVTYPFSEPPRPVLSASRYELGKQMFLEVKCLACHVMGDMFAKGANSSPTAPNLALTNERLQRRWVRAWLQYPAQIQPGTKMPQWWGRKGSLESFPPEDQAEFAKKYGETPDRQMTLLEDFLWEAGHRNDVVIDPNALKPAEPSSAPAEGGDEFEDDSPGGKKPAASQPAKKPADEFEP